MAKVNALGLPKMKINGFRDILGYQEIDRFESSTADDVRMKLTVHIGKSGQKYFVIHTTFQVYGWTVDPHIAFHAWGNLGMYTAQELYDGLRGRKI